MRCVNNCQLLFGISKNIKLISMQPLLWILFFSIGREAVGQVPAFGLCPDVEVMQNFDAKQYLGKWYEVEKYFAVFQLGGKCTTAEYSLKNDSTVRVVNSQISSLTGRNSSIDGIATFQGQPNESKLIVNFPSLPISIDAPYWILETDYENYAVIWSCTSLGVFSVRFAWILTRVPNPSVAVMEKAYQVLDKNNIDKGYLTRTDQKNCPAIY